MAWIYKWMAVIGAISTLAGAARGATSVQATRTRKSPAINGKLDEACWKAATPIKVFKIQNSTQPAKFSTTAMVVYDESALYFGFICHEPDIKSIKTSPKPFDGRVFGDDCIEIMLDPTGSRNEYFHFAVNASGSRADLAHAQGGFVGDAKWNGEWEARSFVSGSFWSCEVAIPFYNLGITPKVTSVWGINLCREKRRPGENSSIAKNGAFNIAGSFAELRGLNIDLRRYCYGIGPAAVTTAVEHNALSVRVDAPLRNDTGKHAKVRLECVLIDPSRKTHVDSSVIDIPAGEESGFTAGSFKLKQQGVYQCQILVSDPKTKRLLALRSSVLRIEYVPMAIRVITPWYRYAIFETQKLERVVFDVETRLKPEVMRRARLTAAIRRQGKTDVIVSKSITTPGAKVRVDFPVEKLPCGKLEIVATLAARDGKTLAETRQRLHKLPYKKGEVWRGQDMNWHVDGKPFFINAVWGYPKDYNPYYNAAINSPSANMMEIGAGTCFGFPPAIRPKIRAGTFDDEVRDFYRKRVNKAKDKPNLLGHFLVDEPTCAGYNAKVLEAIYQVLAEEDPYHPVITSYGTSLTGIRDFARCCDMNLGRHCYPTISRDKRHSDLSKVVLVLDDVPKVFENMYHKQTTGWLQQGFNYGDCSQVNTRVPSYMENRNENLLALTLGANGFLAYPRTVSAYPELSIGMPHLAKEQLYLGRAVLAPRSELPVNASTRTMKTLLKDVAGNLFLFACNAQMEPSEVLITIPGISKRARQFHVISEERTVKLQGDSFTDAFDTFQVHVYTTSRERPELMPIKEICRLIEEAYTKRRKPGNLAYQRHEGLRLILRASSNTASGLGGRADNGLWHVTDGVTNTSFDKYKCLTWQDSTKNKFPDWIELQFKQAHSIGRVKVYPYAKSLRDYSVQALVDDRWQDLDKVAGRKEDLIAHTFKSVKTDKIRIWVTAANGPHSRITEIEVYEK